MAVFQDWMICSFGEIHELLQYFLCFSIPEIYSEMYRSIESADSQQDLKWFSNFHGVDMPMNWPAFEVQWLVTFISGIVLQMFSLVCNIQHVFLIINWVGLALSIE